KPLVIVECGFLSNWEEAGLLDTQEYQEKMAEAICAGVMEYLENF
ncbi:MAG: N-acetylmuramoyl-L-alanine amidase, partial [Hespellia sp.]|nr:N-acetylmuramoyl-L-alanine amidase [Hespellia sp.]